VVSGQLQRTTDTGQLTTVFSLPERAGWWLGVVPDNSPAREAGERFKSAMSNQQSKIKNHC
jgi:hypothetical protein